MAINSLDALIAGLRPPVSLYKASAAAEGAATMHSLFRVAGNPGAGSTPPAASAGSGYTCDRTTPGAIPRSNPVSGEARLGRITIAGSAAGMVILYDRLWACSGFVTNIITTQSITTPGTIPSRDANGDALGAGVELWGEVYTIPGATGATWTASYTNQDGTAGRSATYTHPANAETAGQMLPFTLQAGDTGVRSVQSLVCSISSGTAGDIGLTLLRRIAEVPIATVNVGQVLDGIGAGLPRIYDDSCLALMVSCTTTLTGIVVGSLVETHG